MVSQLIKKLKFYFLQIHLLVFQSYGIGLPFAEAFEEKARFNRFINRFEIFSGPAHKEFQLFIFMEAKLRIN